MTVADTLGMTFIASGAAVQPTSLTQGQLQSNKTIGPFAKPVLLDGIRFRAEAGITNEKLTDGALSLRARVWAGPFAFTNDFIAPAGVAVREQYSGGEVGATTIVGFGGSLLFGTVGAGQVNPIAGQYTWRFDEPLYLPAGVPLRISLKRFTDNRDDYVLSNTYANSLILNTGASAFGRYFPDGITPPPGPVPIPYASTFVDPTIPAVANPAVSQIASPETDLMNQTSDTLFITRMIGRLPARNPTVAIGGSGFDLGEYTGPEPLIRITRTYSGGRDPGGYGKDPFGRANHRALVDPMKPFNAVFDLQSRAIELDGIEMPPGAAFLVTILKQTSQVNLMANIRVFPIVGLLGFRLESWQ